MSNIIKLALVLSILGGSGMAQAYTRLGNACGKVGCWESRSYANGAVAVQKSTYSGQKIRVVKKK